MALDRQALKKSKGIFVTKPPKLRVAILGTGNIGTDLLFKVRRSPHLKCSYFVGRRSDSPGLEIARNLGISALSGGIGELMHHIDDVDLVFDATSARDHLEHVPKLVQSGCHVVNLTPAKSGDFYVPGISAEFEPNTIQNLNMITCGGQTTIPVIHAIKKAFPELQNVEIVSTISSKSAGPATRRNLDEYIENTEQAINVLTSIKNSKALLVLNPAVPEIVMHTSIYFDLVNITADNLSPEVDKIEKFVQNYCPGYSISSSPEKLEKGQIQLSISVKGAGDYLPVHAGNLDIINEAAIYAANLLAVSGAAK